MSILSWLRNWTSKHAPQTQRRPAARRFRPSIEMLEDRAVPAVLSVATSLDVVEPNDGVLSLREAISAAAPSGDTINFNSSLSGQTIALTGGELAINKSLNIQGPGASNLAISGNHSSRVFAVAAQVSLAG